jgi:RNA polymerase sigma-70 factor (ECF subfamily)
MADPKDLAARLAQRTGRQHEDSSRLDSSLQQSLMEARSAWPTVELSDEDFIDHLATRIRAHETPEDLLRRLKLPDLYLACAAERGQPAAIAAFDDALLRRVGQFIAHVSRAPDVIADVTQAVRVKLFVSGNGRGKLSHYSGRGALDSWVCTVAIRTAYDLRREQSPRAMEDDHALGVLAATDDPELELLRRRFDGAFRVALESALSSLESRQRTLLRLYFIEQLTAAQIAPLYRVHEVTILRWIASAQEAVFDHVRAGLLQTLGLSSEELDELLALMRSRLDISVGRLLQTRSHH